MALGSDPDTIQYGINPPYRGWEADHTGLVHVLWSAQYDGEIPKDVDCDSLASRIMQSRWMAAVRAEAAR